jgi:DNA polymerase delta subunit 1
MIDINDFYRKKDLLDKNKKSFTFQALEWIESNEKIIECEDEEDEEMLPKTYVIRIFGVTDEGKSICVTVDDFCPYFYIRLPNNNWTSSKLNRLIDSLCNFKLFSNYTKSILKKQCKIVYKKEYYGFTNNEMFPFAKLVFNNSYAMKKAANIFEEYDITIDNKSEHFSIYESNLDSILRFIHIQDLKASGWMKCSNVVHVNYSKTQIDIKVNYKNVTNFTEYGEQNAPILQASFDIETYSEPKLDLNNNKYYPFPIPEIEGNVVYQIATCFKVYGSSNFYVKHLLTLKKYFTKEKNEKELFDDNTYVKECRTEKELLKEWVKLIRRMDPDILYTYNGDSFDCKYLCSRAKLLGITEYFMEISRLIEYPSQIKTETFESRAHGKTIYERLYIPGRINFDILIFIRRNYKEKGYKLDDISEKYLKEKKHDIKAIDIFKAYEKGDIKEIGDYCIQDTLLPQKLVDVLSIFQTQISMSNVTSVPIKYLITRGEQIKAFSQICRLTRTMNYCIPVLKFNEDDVDNKFEGATVLEPRIGAYFTPVTVCDFASLYPSIIRAHNLCHTTLLMNDKYLNLPNVEYKEISWKDKYGTKSFTYVQNIKGVLPLLLEDLAIQRKKYKKLMNGEKDEFKKEIYNKIQLAYKLSMNSVYGILGAKGKLTAKSIAATVTATGRKMIHDTKEYIESNYKGSEVIYGDTDSVFICLKTKSLEEFKNISKELKLSKGDIKEELQNRYKTVKDKLMEESFKMGADVAKSATDNLFKEPIDLAFEKVILPLYMMSKKRYIGGYYESNPYKRDKIIKSGVVVKRRDNCNFLQTCYNGVMDPLVDYGELGIDIALKSLKENMENLINNKIDIKDLSIVKTIKEKYVTQCPQYNVAKKIAARDPGKAPKPNDRVNYVLVEHNDKNAKAYEKAEDPEYVIKNSIKLDYSWYINNQLYNPITELLSTVIPIEPDKIFVDTLRDYTNKKNKQTTILKWLGKK